jgi:hypothetical protein
MGRNAKTRVMSVAVLCDVYTVAQIKLYTHIYEHHVKYIQRKQISGVRLWPFFWR